MKSAFSAKNHATFLFPSIAISTHHSTYRIQRIKRHTQYPKSLHQPGAPRLVLLRTILLRFTSPVQTQVSRHDRHLCTSPSLTPSDGSQLTWADLVPSETCHSMLPAPLRPDMSAHQQSQPIATRIYTISGHNKSSPPTQDSNNKRRK